MKAFIACAIVALSLAAAYTAQAGTCVTRCNGNTCWTNCF